VIQSSKGVFLSYASEDSGVAKRICEALRHAGIEVWFDQSELRGGDAWDQKIRQQIRDCALFVPIISAHTQARPEGYFRLEWKLAVDRSHLMAAEKAFLVPVVVDATTEPEALVPTQFRDVQWTRIRASEVPAAFVDRIAALLNQPVASHVARSERAASRTTAGRLPIVMTALSVAAVVALVTAAAMRGGWLSQKPVPKVEASSTSAPVATTPAVISEKSVAVLPFVDMSEKKDQEYFSDGLSEELIDRLAHSPDLKVIARTSSFQFKGKNEDVRTIGKRLGVANLLEGSVRTSRRRLRITAQLIKVSDGAHLWSETYDRDMGDIFKVQDSIASAVVSALQATIANVASNSASRPRNLQSYDALLRGQYFLEKGTKQDFERASTALQEAIRLDPANATAWERLSDMYSDSGRNGWLDPAQARTQALKAAERALAIDPNLASAHWHMCEQQLRANLDLQAAEVECKRARELEPNSLKGTNVESDIAFVRGDLSESVRFAQRAMESNPLDPAGLYSLANALVAANRLPEAERTARSLVELHPDFFGAKCLLGDVLLLEQKPDAALTVMREEADEGVRLTCMPDALWALGLREDADAMLATAKSKYADSFAAVLAGSYAMRGDPDEAFKWLARAYDNRDEGLMFMKLDPSLRKLHGDRRFTALLRKLKLPE
jgi:TolB-like protein/Flp pilus assembly protein TadD